VVTAVISDLHLGTRTKGDLLARRRVREKLIGELESVDQVILLGDSIELRDGPLAEALDAATPFFEDLGEALTGRRVTVVPGNHDYQLASRWVARRRAAGAARPLGLEELSTPRAGDPLHQLGRRMTGTELVLAYPGVWLRSDMYATHGHYLDCHNQVPTFECLARALSERLTGAPASGYSSPDDYEAVLAPVYGLIDRIAGSRRARHVAGLGKAAVRWWERLNGYRGRQGRASRLLGRTAAPAALAALDRLGLGTFRSDPGRVGMRRPGVEAMGQVVDRLGIDADYVLFGHLHRPGWWRVEGGIVLVNTGSWIYEPAHLGASLEDSPYWPGTCVFARDEGPPELTHLLRGLSQDELGAGMP
jgi:predicted phosphodiesterase